MRSGAPSGPRKTMPTWGGMSPPNLSSPESRVSVQSLSSVMVLRSIAALPEARVSAASTMMFWKRTVPAAMAKGASTSGKVRLPLSI